MKRNRRKIAVLALCLASLGGFTPTANAATRIKFSKGSYCGSYSGNYRSGREFVLSLKADQRLVIRNTGVGRQTTWAVTSPGGYDLDYNRIDDSTLEYYTEERGNHYILVTSTASRSSVQFCAY